MNSIRFEMLLSPSPVMGQPIYADEDYAFDFKMDPFQEQQRVGAQGTTSLVIDTLQLEVAIDSFLCLYIWGYCPIGRWELSSLSPPIAQRGSLRVSNGESLVPGVSVGLEEMMPANAQFDPESGWFCMGKRDAESTHNAEAVEFATGCLAVITSGRLLSLWIKPENWKDVTEIFLKQTLTQRQ